MSKKPSGKSARVQSKATERARREAIADIQKRLDKADGTVVEAASRDNDSVAFVVLDKPAPLTDAERAGAQQVASIDVDPAKETAAAEKHAARGKSKKGGQKKGDKPGRSKPGQPKRLSALDAAAQVLGKSDKPMTSQALIDEMAAKGLWKSPGGKTPSATLYAAVLREIGAKGKDSRFKKVDRGLFLATGKGA